jgi:hypothetical protein
MKIIDYKLVSKEYKWEEDSFESYDKHFEKLIKKHLENGYTPLGGVSFTLIDNSYYILLQSLVLYGK